MIQGPVCDSSEVMGWHLKKMKNLTVEIPPIHISSFAFNSSTLWDPERWGRAVPTQQTTQVQILSQLITYSHEVESFHYFIHIQEMNRLRYLEKLFWVQNSLGYVKKEVVEGEAKLKGIPMEGCSKVLLWDLQIVYY